MSKIKTILFSCACFLLSWVVILTTVDICSFDRSFYEKEYTEAHTAQDIGMSQEDLMLSTDALLDYLKDERNDIVVEADILGNHREVFNERETEHMVDVKELYQNAVMIRNYMAFCGVAFLMFGILLAKKETLQYCRNGFKYGVSLTLLFVAMAAFYAVLDFTNFWFNFHRLFFHNDLWILDPNTSIMINMFPENFFGDLVMKIIMITAGILAACTVLLYLPRRKNA